MIYTVIHETECPDCRSDLTQVGSIRVHFSVEGQESDCLSRVDKDGRLWSDVGPLIASGCHAGSDCNCCGEQLEELVADEEPKTMQWYARTESGDVRGPMSEENARFEADRLPGAVMYSERIFEPQFVTTSEVDTLIAEMRSSVSMRPTMPNHIFLEAQGLLTRAIDTITLLCKKPEFVTPEVEKFLSEVPEEIASLLLDLDAAMKDGELDGLRELCKRAIDGLVFLSAKKLVTGILDGGVLYIEELPAGVEVKINDYDIKEPRTGTLSTEDCLSEGCLTKDEAGRKCVTLTFRSRG